MRYTKETFTQELQKRFPFNQFEILEFNGAFKPIKYRCLTCNRIVEKNRANHLYENKTLCQHCFSAKTSMVQDWIYNFFETQEQFILLNWSGNTGDNLLMHCNNCNSDFAKQPNNLYKKQIKTICPCCGENGAPVPQAFFEQLMQEKGYTDYTVIDYKAITRSVKLRHSCGYVFSQIGCNFLKSRGCPKCYKTLSKGEIQIEKFLLKNSIKYIYSYKPEALQGLSYDFYLPELNTFIEYQGQQHYFPIDYFGGEKKFQEQLKHDKQKYDYAADNNYKLILIPYTDYDKINSYLLPLVGSTTSQSDVASSEAKEKSTNNSDNIVCSYVKA